MERISSPGMYSRTSANSIPWPLKEEEYAPDNTEFTIPVVRISIWWTFFKTSFGIMLPPRVQKSKCKVQSEKPGKSRGSPLEAA